MHRSRAGASLMTRACCLGAPSSTRAPVMYGVERLVGQSTEDRMIKPTLRQYNLTQAQVDNIERQDKNRFNWFMGLAVVFACLAGFIIATIDAKDTSLRNIIGPIVGYSVLSLFLSVFVFGVLYAISGNLLEKYSDLHKRVAAFKAAISDYEIWLARTQREFWTSLNGKRFEVELAKLYQKMGYRTSLTPASGDGGIDIVLSKNGRTTIVQCKAHKKPVGPHTVRDLYGTLVSSNADEAILASISGFTSGVVSYAQDKPIRLVSLDDIIRMQKGAE
jgi:Restriction endonuclease